MHNIVEKERRILAENVMDRDEKEMTTNKSMGVKKPIWEKHHYCTRSKINRMVDWKGLETRHFHL